MVSVNNSVFPPPRGTFTAKIQNRDELLGDKLESSPRSPLQEQAHPEKHISLDMTNNKLNNFTYKGNAEKSPDIFSAKEQIVAQDNLRLVAFSRILLAQICHWSIISVGGIVSAICNYRASPEKEFIILTLIFLFVLICNLCYLSATQDLEAYRGDYSRGSFARDLYLNVFKLVALTLSICALNVAFSSFSQIFFNIVSMSVLLSLGGFFCLARFSHMFPKVRHLLNGSLVAASISLNIFGLIFFAPYLNNWLRPNPFTLVAATIVGFLFSAAFLIQSRSFSIDNVQQRIAIQDYGCAGTVNIYTVFMSKLWIKIAGKELYDQN
ncbi:uncharacterized protein LOC100907433 [Galendromus occidentalis]|uniref:Uncharacterized protein LOC100907433 n=1 Tax=Galendromus occidentalis TaxID=34638 RepID=A0AAJ6VZD6_9ACAR|nr:uncharacterized protein LOC100907433 [Galendromus occidentalis]